MAFTSTTVTLPATGEGVEVINITGDKERQVVAIGGAGDNQDDVIGALTETAPATDTASAGLNGRLQRIAQRITTLIASAATAAKQPALGTAGTASADVITVQGITSMTPLLVTASAGTNLNTSALALESGGNLAAIATSLAALDNAVSGNELQVDVLTLPALAAGTNNIGDVDVLSVIPGTGATNLGKAEDAAHASGDVGVMALAVRADTAAATSGTDGDYQPILTNPRGATWVAIEDGAGGQVTSFSGGTQYTEDAAAAADPVGPVSMLVRKDTPAGIASTDGDNVAQRGTNYGAAYVQVITSSGSFVDSFGGSGGTAAADDADFTATSTQGTPAMGVYESSPTSVTDGDMGIVGITAARRLKTSATIDAALPAGTNNIGDVDILSIAAGDNNIGNVDIVTMPNVTLAAGTNTNEVVGDAAHDATAAGNPVLVGGYASAAAPTNVSADGDVVNAWRLRNGAAATVITAAGALIGGDATNGLDVDVTRIASGAIQSGAIASGAIASGAVASGAVASGAIASGALAAGSISAGAIATGATSIAANEDDASANADTGIKVLFKRLATPANSSGTDGDYEQPQMSAGRIWVSATVDAALPAGTNGIGKLTANSGVTIGAVELAAAQTLATVTTVGTVTTLTGGGIAHDSADSGNPIKVGAKAKSTLSGVTLVAADDRADNYCDLDGALLTRADAALGDLVSGNASNTDGTSTQVIAAGAAGIKHYITDVTITNTSSSNIYVELKDNTTVKWTFPVPANGGVTHHFRSPLAGTAATAWNFDPSAAASTVYCSASGFKSKI